MRSREGRPRTLSTPAKRLACEAAKSTQNAIYVPRRMPAKSSRPSEKLACEVQKTAELNLCRLGNIHSGDFIGPMTENLFARARDESLSDWKGEAELLANALLRIRDGRDRDNTGDDLNLIVMMLMAKLRTPTATQRGGGRRVYAAMRPFSYGSYLTHLPRDLRSDADDMTARMDEGIRSGWRADKPAANGAGALVSPPRVGRQPRAGGALRSDHQSLHLRRHEPDVLSTPTSLNPAPTVATVSPDAGLSAGGTIVTIKGSGFLAGTTVLVDGAPARNVRVVDGTTLTADDSCNMPTAR